MFRKITLFVLSLVILTALVGSANAQDETVAILVIDVFEPLERPSPDAELRQPAGDENCLLAPSGQGHTFIGGASAFTITQGQGHTYIGGAASGKTIPPHGRLVYLQLQDLIEDERGGKLDRATTGESEFGVAWLRDIEFWRVEGGTVILAAVDTDGYTTQAIVDRIPGTIELLGQWGVDRFVLNMSFAIIPCDVLARTEAENFALYETILEKEFPALAQKAREAAKAPSDVFDRAEFAEVRMAYQSRIFRQASQQFYTTALSDYEDALLEHDPLRKQLEELLKLSTSGGAAVISVASAGNMGDAFPFAPGYWPSVVSVSADYTQAQRCPAPLPLRPASNAGEVMANGVHNLGRGQCIYGTSFAAPRLSLEAALYLLFGGPISCGGTVGSSLPPLAHLPWNDLPRFDASTQYCDDFNRLVP